MRDFFHPDRILIGASELIVRRRLGELYDVFGVPVIVTDIPTAELTKHAANAFLATRLSFVNAMANICEAAGADVHQMMKVVGLDPRIGPKFLSAGPGWGGSCLPKDTRALAYVARQLGEPFEQLESTVRSNEEAIVVAAGSAHACQIIIDGTVRCWGHNNFGQLGNDIIQGDGSVAGSVDGSAYVSAARTEGTAADPVGAL